MATKKKTTKKPKPPPHFEIHPASIVENGQFTVGKYEGRYSYQPLLQIVGVAMDVKDLELTAYRSVSYKELLPVVIIDAVRALTQDKNL